MALEKDATAGTAEIALVDSVKAELSCGDNLDADKIRQQLSRILSSPCFSLSNRLSRFLQYVVEAALRDEAGAIKEYVIGTEVYDRRPSYNPSIDSIVRTEARRLRSKLKQYYDSEGRSDLVFISFQTGSYVPRFSIQRASAQDLTMSSVHTGDRVNFDRLDVSITVTPCENAADNPTIGNAGKAISKELGEQLISINGCQVRVLCNLPCVVMLAVKRDILVR